MARAHDPVLARIPQGERVYAVGDVHGRLDLFEDLVAQIRIDNAARGRARVRIVLLGDLVDRGPSSAQLIERCRSYAERSGNFIVLKGNHESMMVDAVRGSFPALALWLRSGGRAALMSFGVPETLIAEGPSPELIAAARAHIPAETLAWVDRLPLSHRIGDYLFVHAGVRPGLNIEAQTPQDLLWIRADFLDSAADHGVVIVHGHSIDTQGVTFRPNRIGIDTGAYRTGTLTALALEEDRCWTLATNGAGEQASAERRAPSAP